MDTAVTSRLLEDINKITQVHDKSKKIIIALVKRQRVMEQTFISNMDKDLKLKSDKDGELIAKVTATIDARLKILNQNAISKWMRSTTGNKS